MRNRIFASLLACGSLYFLMSMPAFGMVTDELQVNVPFRFRVEKTVLPAGRYLIKPLNNYNLNLLVIRNEADGKAVVVLTEPLSPKLNVPQKSELVFQRVGKLDYLTQIWEGDTYNGNEIPERALEGSRGSGTAQQHTVPAHKS